MDVKCEKHGVNWRFERIMFAVNIDGCVTRVSFESVTYDTSK